MKLIKTASGKNRIKIAKSEWTAIGKKAGWIDNIKEKIGLGQPKENVETRILRDLFGKEIIESINQKMQSGSLTNMSSNEAYSLKDIMARDMLPQDWLNKLTQFIVQAGTVPLWAKDWAQQSLRSYSPSINLINAINQFVEKNGFPPEFAQKWIYDIFKQSNIKEFHNAGIKNLNVLQQWYRKAKKERNTVSLSPDNDKRVRRMQERLLNGVD